MTCCPILAEILRRWVLMLLLVCGCVGAAVAQTPATAPAQGNKLPPAQKATYNPAGLVANENATGAVAICAAEGQCDLSGAKRPSYYGHKDYGNGAMNYGWCSANTAFHPDAVNDNGAAACRRHTAAGVQSALSYMRAAGFTPEDPINMELFINYIDLYNQTPYVAEKAFLPVLTRLCRPGTKCTSDQIRRARIEACVSLGCKDAAGQTRRVEAIASILSGGQIVLGDPGDLGKGGLGFFNLEITLRETVTALECWSCKLVQAITRVADELGNQTFTLLRQSLIGLLSAMLGIYLVYNAVRVLTPFGPVSSIAGVFSQITLLTGTVLLIIALLGGMSFYWNFIYRPVLTGSMNASMAILNSANALPAKQCNYSGLTEKDVSTSLALAGQITCITRAINDTIATGIRVGWGMIVGSGEQQKKESFSLGNPLTYVNGLKILLLWVSGFILIGVFIYATLAFLWVVLDVVYRWTFVSILSPLAIAAFAFPETRKFSTFATRGLMESFIALILSSIVAALTFKLIEKTGFDPRTTGSTLIAGGIEKYIEALQKADPVIRAPTINTTLFWTLATIGMMAGSLMFKMKDLASYLTSSAMGGWATETGQGITRLSTLTGPLNQIFGRIGSRGMTAYLEKRYADKFGKDFVRPSYAAKIDGRKRTS